MAVDLIKILPEYFRPVLEFKQIMKVDGGALDKLETSIRHVSDNCFIQKSDSENIHLYEELLGYTYKAGETLEFRRQRILLSYTTVPPFSLEFFKQRLDEMFGDEYVLNVDTEECTLFVQVTSSQYGAVDLLYSLVWDIVPAHIQVTANHQVTNTTTRQIYAAGVVSSTTMREI